MLIQVNKALESLAKDSFMVKCADSHQHLYYLIIAGFMADYEK
jgi:hypothetical protein